MKKKLLNKNHSERADHQGKEYYEHRPWTHRPSFSVFITYREQVRFLLTELFTFDILLIFDRFAICI